MTYHANDSLYTGWEGQLDQRVVYEDVGSTTVDPPDWVATELPNATDVPSGR